jgi:hypothetical protein
MGDRRLDGWKEISQYLERDIRTCQRWESEFGLPVYRLNKSSQRSKVFSYTLEIDRWFKETSRNQRLEKRINYHKKLAVSAFLIIASFIAFFVIYLVLISKKDEPALSSVANPNPVNWRLKGSYIVFYDLEDRLLWSVEINNPSPLSSFYYEEGLRPKSEEPSERWIMNKVCFSDVDRDGMNEVLMALHHENPRERCIGLFDNNGWKLWSQSVEFNQEYEGGKIVNDYVVRQLAFNDINNDGKEEILALWRHSRRFPGIFVIYDLNGNQILKYSHTGLLQFFLVSFDNKNHKTIFLAGTNNILDGDAVLSVLDSWRLKSGLAPPYEISPDLIQKDSEIKIYVPKDPHQASQKYYIRFRHNEFSKAMQIKWLSVSEIYSGKNEIIIQVLCSHDKKSALYYYFDSEFNLRYIMPSAEFERKYARLLNEGVFHLSLRDFLKRCEKDVLFWDGKGWTGKPTSLRSDSN